MEEERIATGTRQALKLSSDMDSSSSRKNYKKPLFRLSQIHLLSHHQLTQPHLHSHNQLQLFQATPPNNQHAFHHPDQGPPDLHPAPERLLCCHVNDNRGIPGSGFVTSAVSCLDHQPPQEGPLSPLPGNPQSNALPSALHHQAGSLISARTRLPAEPQKGLIQETMSRHA